MDHSSEQVTIAQAMHSILMWSRSFDSPMPAWQRDALRRLIVGSRLTTADMTELTVLCKNPHGLVSDDEVALDAHPLESKHLPAVTSEAEAVTLRGIRNPKHVNALAPKQSLSFRPSGITVVYGSNGSGKSGYARILKRVCRARCDEDVLSNVYETKPAAPPSATIHYSIGATGQSPFDWEQGKAPETPLSAISVFDSKCAPIHVDQENEAAFTPLPLQILRELAKASREVNRRLKELKIEQEKELPIGLRDPKYHAGTAVSAFMHKLTGKTRHEELGHLVTLSELEETRLQDLREMFRSDPISLAKQLVAQKGRLVGIVERVKSIEDGLGDAGLNEYRDLLADLEAKVEAARAASEDLFKDESLSYMSDASWRVLWDAARAFSSELAYPKREFPCVDDGDVCVLCQQPLSKDAAGRLMRFEEYVKKDAQKNASDSEEVFRARQKDLQSVIPALEQRRQDVVNLRDELQQEEMARKLERVYRVATVRIGRALQVVKSKDWPAFHGFGESPRGQIETMVAELADRIIELQASAALDERAVLEKEWHELEDRVWLQAITVDVKAEIVRQKKLNDIGNAIADADTGRITRKSSELADLLVTAAWRDRFQSEMSKLGCGHLRIKLQRESGAYGVSKFRISLLRSPSTKEVGRILSEGEHRCVALAAFLSELATEDHRSGIVFDDPVSSLDHEYRERVALRLAEEAKAGRQVVVFTHDISFLFMLETSARRAGVDMACQSVARGAAGSGICSDAPPFKALPVLKAIESIHKHLANTRGCHAAGDLDKWGQDVKSIAGHIRDGWELAAEEVVSHVVKRFSNKIKPRGLLRLTSLTELDCSQLVEGYGRCSELAHSDSPELGRPLPHPDQLQEEIDALRDWAQGVFDRQDQIKV